MQISEITYNVPKERCFSSCQKHGTKKKILSSLEESNFRPSDSASDFAKGLRSDTLWELRMFSLSHARDKTKSIFLYFFTKLKTYYLSYFYLLCFCLGIWSDLLNLTSLEFCVPLISFWNGVSAKTTGKTIIIITTLFTYQRDLTLHAANWGHLRFFLKQIYLQPSSFV